MLSLYLGLQYLWFNIHSLFKKICSCLKPFFSFIVEHNTLNKKGFFDKKPVAADVQSK